MIVRVRMFVVFFKVFPPLKESPPFHIKLPYHLSYIMHLNLFFLIITLIQANGLSISSTSQHAKSMSIVTGADGFIGRHVVYLLLQRQESECMLCLVRSKHLLNVQTHWESVNDMNGCSVKVIPYDMLNNGTTLAKALQYGYQHSPEIFCLYHVASTFGPT